MKCRICGISELTSGNIDSCCYKCYENMYSQSQKTQEMLSIKLSKHVHNKCKDVPHDIGLTLIEIIIEHIRF